MLAVFTWNPSPDAFTLPFIEHPVRWYGLFFAAGFAVTYFLMIYMLQCELKESHPKQAPEISRRLVDRLLWYVLIGTVVGARLGHILFYDFDYFVLHPIEIFKVWHGGLASHGGAVGILIALGLFYQKSKKELPGSSFLNFMDLFVVQVPLVGAFIRLGNFVNQEIVGTPADLPWSVLFVNPADPVASVPRHPVQLYEAFAYLLTFFLLYTLWKRGWSKRPGLLSGLSLTLIFSSRFFLEFYKVSQSNVAIASHLDMGQILSLPFIIAGLCLIVKSIKN